MDILACNAGLALGQDQTEPQFTDDGAVTQSFGPFWAILGQGKLGNGWKILDVETHGLFRDFLGFEGRNDD